jgi:hypothetical protein
MILQGSVPHRNERIMPRPKPKTKLSELIYELNEFTQSGNSPKGLALQRFKREAELLKKEDPAAGYLILGILAGFQGKAKEMHHFHKLAIQLSSDNPSYLRNYAASLLNFRCLEEAVMYGRRAFEESTDPNLKLDALNSMIIALDLLGREEEFLKLCNEWERLSGNVHRTLKFGISGDEAQEIAGILSGGDKPDIQSGQFVEVSEDLLSRADDLTRDLWD